ncbi:MAG: amidohydrolase [Candidatus Bathyarchaeota archaeon]|nr:MAG: amidohydrolase [Candidatus Bathyarchaeota archaeon]
MYADLVLTNANILTMNRSKPHAQAIAIKDDRIIGVGTNQEIKPYVRRSTKTIDLKEKTVIPGFIDTHVHLTAFGKLLGQINLRGTGSIKEIQEKLRKQVQKMPKGQWILGRGWDQDRLKEERYPTRWDLDKVSPDNPVVLTRVCGHLCVANSQALQIASITKETISPPTGQIDKNPETDEPTGILREDAMALIWKMTPEPNEEQLTEACSLACRKAVETGLTSIHWLINTPTEIHIIQNLHRQKKLLLRVYIITPLKLLSHLTKLGLYTGFGDNRIRIGSIKIFSDGSLGARTAALSQPYHDKPTRKGIMLHSVEELSRLATKAHKANLQLAIHAIGDQAIDAVLTVLEKTVREAPRKNHRHRIEHASVLNRKLIPRMKRLNVIASIQPHFIISDFWVANRVGSTRARWVYPFRTLIQNDISVSGGSDCPIEPIDPLLGIWAAVARKVCPEERITVDDALRLYTTNAAYASFEESIKGSIEVGKLADFIVLSHDPYEISPDKIRDTKVEMTVIGGRAVFVRQG